MVTQTSFSDQNLTTVSGSENHPTQSLAEGAELKTLREEYEALWSMYVDARAQIAELKDGLREARTTISNTRTNIMVEIGRCADPSESRWEGVPELLKVRLDEIDAALTQEPTA